MKAILNGKNMWIGWYTIFQNLQLRLIMRKSVNVMSTELYSLINSDIALNTLLKLTTKHHKPMC